ncbi:MAG: hypothetical protein U0694_04495 [Anaerolineae bacterium]
MQRIYHIYGLSLWLFLTLAILLALLLGQLQPPHGALTGLNACDIRLCWYSIDMRSSTGTDLYHTLAQQGYTSVNSYLFSTEILAQPAQGDRCSIRVYLMASDRLNLMNLTACPHVLLGDVMALFGPPDDISLCDTVLTLYYNPDHTIVLRLNERGSFSPYTEIVRISLYPVARPSGWHGFAPLWRYRQLAPTANYGQNCG